MKSRLLVHAVLIAVFVFLVILPHGSLVRCAQIRAASRDTWAAVLSGLTLNLPYVKRDGKAVLKKYLVVCPSCRIFAHERYVRIFLSSEGTAVDVAVEVHGDCQNQPYSELFSALQNGTSSFIPFCVAAAAPFPATLELMEAFRELLVKRVMHPTLPKVELFTLVGSASKETQPRQDEL